MWTSFTGLLPAHTPSETYLGLVITRTNISGQWDVARRDLVQGLALDAARIAALSPADFEARQEALALDILARLGVKADAASLPLHATDYFPVTLNNGDYLRINFEVGPPAMMPAVVELDGRVLFTIDPNMHGLIRVGHDGRLETVSFNTEHPVHRFDLAGAGAGTAWGQWLTFVREGVVHIWGGIDHILFLVALLLPAVLRRQANRWQGIERFRPGLLQVVKIVTAFTVAHSLTLSLAALSIVELSPRLVEPVIALSVALAALNNLRPVVQGKGWMVAFGFGLIHGFGFASALGDLGLTGGTLALALVGFNVGVELGQMTIVLCFLPVAFALRRTWFYQTAVMQLGSVVVTLVAIVWIVQRLQGV